ncbi:Na+/H+ antiporter NhaA [Sulfurovum sp.]|uniref:Na+/H+ antiporter NhaA n=1 Tax=Sulfurovum sp. TaxID=1969726 RepID=UPI003C72EFC6
MFGAVYLSDRCGFARKPDSLRWVDIFGASLLGGVEFTMSIFVRDIAFSNTELVNLAKLSIILSSIISGVLVAVWIFKTVLIQNTKL